MRNKILVVDDSKFNRRMLRDEFEADYEIVEAENGLEALTYMEKNLEDICAVLLDIVMPEMDGIQLLKKMNEEKYMNTFPVIVITSEHPIGVVEECFDYGISDFIRKPINPVM
ncbi:MAG: PleD family two-component system response regulator, partial [Lachnospiraceae bacterium]